MTRAIWSPRARKDLRALTAYLRARDPAIARRASDELFAAGDQLVSFPGMGRPGAEPGQRLRSLPAWHLVMVYRVLNGSVEISTLRDTRRDPSDQAED